MANPIKPSLKTEWLAWLLIVLSAVIAVYFYQHFPDRVPTHWDFSGQVDGYSSRAVGAFIMPLMMLGLYLLFLFIPYLDPRREQYAAFAGTYHQFKNLLVAFFFVISILTGLSGLGYAVNIGFLIPVLIGLLFILIGSLLHRVKMNWFMGIRTPWTMSSETVWDKTHALSGRVFMLSGLLIAATALVANPWKLILFIAAIAILVLALPVYSYVLFRQEKAGKK
ncbi:MAG: DUF1648 domain-containing protein [Patescibacteria group bacterium]